MRKWREYYAVMGRWNPTDEWVQMGMDYWRPNRAYKEMSDLQSAHPTMHTQVVMRLEAETGYKITPKELPANAE